MSGVKIRRQSGGSTSDLLKQIEGADGQLTKGVQLRWFGRIGATLLTPAFAYLAKRYGLSWEPAVAAVFLGASVSLVGVGRAWIKSAKEPFRYTFSVAPFEPASKAEATGKEAQTLRRACDWIRADLILMLSE